MGLAGDGIFGAAPLERKWKNRRPPSSMVILAKGPRGDNLAEYCPGNLRAEPASRVGVGAADPGAAAAPKVVIELSSGKPRWRRHHLSYHVAVEALQVRDRRRVA